jgi:hypothetical protein
MADFTPVGTQIKPPQGMSLGEMVNMANAAQQYQQAQQMNPVQLERAQTELGRLKTLLPLEVSSATSQAGKSGIEYNLAGETFAPKVSLAKSQAATAEQETLKNEAAARLEQLKLGGGLRQQALEAGGSIISHPDVLAATGLSPKSTKDEIKKAQNSLVGVIDKEVIPRLRDAGLSPAEIEMQRISLSQQALSDPQGFQSYLKRGTQLAGGAQTLVQQNLPQLTSLSTGQPGTVNLSQNTARTFQGAANVNPPKADVELGAEYNKGLQSRVQAANDWMQRSSEMKPLLETFKAGAGSATYAALGQKLQALGAPDDLVNKVANGDLSATQTFQKFMAGSIMSAARQASEGSPFAAEVKNFTENNPNITSDPKTLKRFIDFYDRLAGVSLNEVEAQAQAKDKGIYNPGTWQADWQKMAQKQGLLPATPSAKVPSQANQPQTQSFKEGQTGKYNGRNVIFKNGQWGYQ